jgi:excisionase family DNA binding protein
VAVPDYQSIDPDATYTLREAARLADVTEPTVRRAIEAGRIRATREDRGWNIVGVDLLAWHRARHQPDRSSRRWSGRGGNVSTGYLTAAQAAALAGVSRAAVYLAIADGRLPARTGEHPMLIDAADVLRWRQGRR